MNTSLVGTTVVYRAKGEVVTDSFDATKKEIVTLTKKAHIIGGKVGIVLLSEMYNYHKESTHFLAVRSSFNNGRKVTIIKEYLESFSLADRVKDIKKNLAKTYLSSEERELWVEAAKFFSRYAPKYREEFKEVLTKEEYRHIN